MISKTKYLIGCLILMFLLISCSTFDGYYYNLDDARNVKKHYENSDYLFTEEFDDVIIDFIIKDDVLHIVKIDCKSQDSKIKYKVKNTSSYSIKEKLTSFESQKTYVWSTTSVFQTQVEWCIVSKDFNTSNENLISFEFIYDDENYCLCYNFLDD